MGISMGNFQKVTIQRTAVEECDENLQGPWADAVTRKRKKLRKKRRSEGWDTLTLNLLIEIGRIDIIISHLQNCRFQIFLRVL